MIRVITLARQLGSMGSEVASNVARQTGFRYMDRALLHQAAELSGYPDQAMIDRLEHTEHSKKINIFSHRPTQKITDRKDCSQLYVESYSKK